MGENKSLYRLIVWKKPSCCLPQLLLLGGNSSEAPCVLPPGRWDPRVKGRSGHRAAGDWSSPDLNRFNKAKKNKKASSRKKNILKSVKITHYYSYLLKYNNVFIIFHLRPQTGPPRRRRDQIEELHAKAADAKSAAEEAPGKEAAD